MLAWRALHSTQSRRNLVRERPWRAVGKGFCNTINTTGGAFSFLQKH